MKKKWALILIFFAVLLAVVAVVFIKNKTRHKNYESQSKVFHKPENSEPFDTLWHGRNKDQIPANTDSGRLILYGYNLIANTSYYLGPKGTVAQISNGMNCQNCHLNGGTVPYGNNFGRVYATYPQFRARNNGMQNIYDRINDCFERSLNGQALDSNTHEMRAIYAYMKWLGDGIPKGDARGGTGIMKLKYLDTTANPLAGRKVYVANCQSCHGRDGHGVLNDEGTGIYFLRCGANIVITMGQDCTVLAILRDL